MISDHCIIDIPSNYSSLMNWIMGTTSNNLQTRYGGFTLGIKEGDDTSSDPVKPGATVWYENSGYHALPVYVNALSNARLKRLTDDSYSIKAHNHPIIFAKYSQSPVSM